MHMDEANTLKVFISYSHESPQHADRVLALSNRLRKDGVDSILDLYEESPSEGWPLWMDRQIHESDFVLMICTEIYYRRVMKKEQPGKGLGVQWEGHLIYQHFYDAGALNTKFIPVLLDGGTEADIPTPYRSVTHYRPTTSVGYEKLYRRLTGQPLTLKPKPGKRRKMSSRQPNTDIVQKVTNVSSLEGLHDLNKSLKSKEKSLNQTSSRISQLRLLEYELSEVFVRSGVPDVTFVEREDFKFLKLSLAEPGRGIVIEGPTGAGKTTAWRKALDQLKEEDNTEDFVVLNARNQQELSKILSLQEWHRGPVIIDDFHRLYPSLHKKIAHYLKYLADNQSNRKKLVVVGIPHTGQTLVRASFDVATRIDVFRMGAVSNELILQMIKAGEAALNIKFEGKNNIVEVASGSLNIAQYLCYNICSREGIIRTQSLLRTVLCEVEKEIPRVMEVLSSKFGETVRLFALLVGFGDSTCLKLLELLAKSEYGFLSLSNLRARRPDLVKGIEFFIDKDLMEILYHECPDSRKFLLYNKDNNSLIIDDPQMTFYLKKLQFSELAKEIGIETYQEDDR